MYIARIFHICLERVSGYLFSNCGAVAAEGASGQVDGGSESPYLF